MIVPNRDEMTSTEIISLAINTLNTLRSDNNTKDGQINTLNNRVTDLQSTISGLESDKSSLQTTVNTRTGYLNDIYSVITGESPQESGVTIAAEWGVNVVAGVYDQYSVYVDDIISALYSDTMTKDATIDLYIGYLDGVYTVLNTDNIITNDHTSVADWCDVIMVDQQYSAYSGYVDDVVEHFQNFIVDDLGVFNNCYATIRTMGGTVPANPSYLDRLNLDSMIATIPQSGGGGGSSNQYLDAIYTTVVTADQNTSIVQGSYNTYNQGVQDVIDHRDATIATKNGQISTLTATNLSLQTTINNYEMNFGSIYTAIVGRGGTCTENDYSTYASGVNSIPSDASIQAQLDAANALLTQYRGYFADIATAITSKGGTVTDSTDYSSYDDYVASIPSGTQVAKGVVAFGNLKTQINDFDVFGNNNVRDNHILVCQGDCEDMFRYMGDNINGTILRSTPMYSSVTVNLAGVTNVTNMFGHVTEENGSLYVDTYLGELRAIVGGFGVGYNGDLSLDLRCFENVDLDNFKNTIPNNTSGYVREFILRTYNYNQNVGWGGVAKLRQKGYTVTDGGETFT